MSGGAARIRPVEEVPYSINQFMTPHNSTAEDARQYAASGAIGISLMETKLGPPSEDGRVREQLAGAGLRVAYCLPSVWPMLPGPLDTAGTPQEVPARAEAICASVERFAVFEPLGVIVGGGRSGDPDHPAGPLDEIPGALATIADVAAAHGTRLGFEMLGASRGAPYHSFEEMIGLLDEVGRDNLGILFDVIHSWNEPGLHQDIARHVDRIDFVQVGDVRDPERTWADRLLPGEGRGVAAPILASLLAAGYDGWFELEVFSDDGTFGVKLENSLWAIPHGELLRRGREAFERVYAEAAALAEADGAPAR
jgi:sugar phosphate isomerase/epimerase